VNQSRELPAELQTALSELKQALTALYGERLQGVYLYGSYSRGDYHPNSDIDVLIALTGDGNPADEISRYSQVVSEICLRHDLLIGTYPVSAHSLAERHDPFFQNVRREAVPV
jgi:uncharacterized protein